MTEPVALYELDGAVAIITLNRPDKRNAIDTALKEALTGFLRQAEADDAVAVVVLRGAGKSFCAGADLSANPDRAKRAGNGLGSYVYYTQTLDFHRAIWGLKKPVIASVQGHALGAGCELAMMCDMTIAADTARFGEPEVRFGPPGAAVVMPWIIGHKRARELLYMGDQISAQTACEYGMVNRVVPADRLEAETLNYAKRLAKIGREVLMATKIAVNLGIEASGFRVGLDAGAAIVSLGHLTPLETQAAFRAVADRDGPSAAAKRRNAEFEE